MKVTCNKCGAQYNIPDSKLSREVNKATCKKCGNKIVIKKDAGAEADELARLSEGDLAVAQDERTIITVPSELESMESSAPIARGILNPLELERRGQQSAPRKSEEAALPSASDTGRQNSSKALSSVAEAGRQSGSSGTYSGSYSPAPASLAAMGSADQGAGVGGTMAAASGGRDSSSNGGQLPGSPSQGPGATGPAIAGAGGNRANVAAIFVQKQEEREAEAAQIVTPPSPLPTIFMGVALFGLLLFLPKGIWTVQPRTVLGFLMALYGLTSALMVHRDFTRTGEVNYVRCLALPLIPCLLFAGYWKMAGVPTTEPEAEVAPAADASGAAPADAAAAPATGSEPGAPGAAAPAAGQ